MSNDVETGRLLAPAALRPIEEVWLCMVSGEIWVEVTDHKGAPRSRSVSGTSGRLRITTEDRIRCQERVLDPVNDPFTNGCLIRVDADQQVDPITASADAMTNEQLAEAFELAGGDFEDFLDAISEVNVRRMLVIAHEINAGVQHHSAIKDIIERKFAVGGTTDSNEQARTVQ